MTQFNNGAWTYLYNADDQRVAILKDGTATTREQTFMVRSLTGQVLREFKLSGDDPVADHTWDKDYIYAPGGSGGNLLASVRADGTTRHYHRDHLGTPRLITDASGAQVGRHNYLPYGEEVTDPSQNDEVMKYTLHQRDKNFAGTDDDLDYMLARYYSQHLGRFMSCDPVKGDATRLKTLNRYAYAWGNPVKYVDPDGRDPQEGKAGNLDDSPEEDGKPTFFDWFWVYARRWFPGGASGGGPGGSGGGSAGAPAGTIPNDGCDERPWMWHCNPPDDPCAGYTGTGSAATVGWKHVTDYPWAEDVLDVAVALLEASFDTNGAFSEHGRYAYGSTQQLGWSRVFEGNANSVEMPVASDHFASLRLGLHTHPAGLFTTSYAGAGDRRWAHGNAAPYLSFSPHGIATVMPDGSTAAAPWSYFGRGWGGSNDPDRRPCK